MKKLYTLTLALGAALMASAAAPQMTGKYASQRSAAAFERTAVERTARMSRAEAEFITNPEGTATTYLLESLNFEIDFLGGLVLMNEKTVAEIVWAEDGSTVYLKDIMLGTGVNDIYVEGEYKPSTIKGIAGTITVEFPQVCSVEDDGMGGAYYDLATLMTLTLDDDNYVVASNVDADDNFVTYNVYEDGTIKLALNDGNPNDPTVLPPYIIGLVDEYVPGEDTWLGYGVAYAEYGEFDYEATTMPEGLETETWAILSGSGNKIVEIGFEGDKLYMTGFSQLLPESVVTATVDGDKLEMDFPQYMGSYDGLLLFFQAEEWDSDMFAECTPLDHLTLNYDADAKRISVDNPLIDMGVCIGDERDALWEYFENPVIVWLDQDLVNANPQPPYVAYYEPYEYRDWYDSYEGYIEWIIPSINVNEQPLDPERMYYNLYSDGELLTLTVEDYPGFDEDVTDIPYDFGDDFDLQAMDESHYLTFKFDGAETFGCQSYYLGTDGVTYRSGIVTYDVATGECGINSVAIADKAVKSVELYNLQGQRVNNPHGITLHKITYADGTVKTLKTVRK